jgi:Argininosuccinate lyase
MKVFNVKNSMNSKNSYGGTSSNNVRKMLRKYKKEIKS